MAEGWLGSPMVEALMPDQIFFEDLTASSIKIWCILKFESQKLHVQKNSSDAKIEFEEKIVQKLCWKKKIAKKKRILTFMKPQFMMSGHFWDASSFKIRIKIRIINFWIKFYVILLLPRILC